MKKCLIILLIPILHSCSKTNEFANRNFKLVSVAEMVSLYGVEVRVPEKMFSDRITILEFTDSEAQFITYSNQNKVLSSSKINYSVSGSFIYLENEKHEIRHNKDTIELYKGSNMVYQLVPQN